MTDIVGGLRNRYLRDSFTQMLEEALGDLGWFDSGRRHRDLEFVPTPKDWDELVEPNALAVSMSPTSSEEIELGSTIRTDTHSVLIDLLAEGDSFGVDLSGDIREVLRGRLGRARVAFPIYNYAQGSPGVIGYADIDVDSISIERVPTRVEKAWLRHWFVITCQVVDTYGDDQIPDDPLPEDLNIYLVTESGDFIITEFDGNFMVSEDN